MPCLVFVDVTASDFRCQGISFVDPPKIGLHLYACVRASVACRFTGGPTVYGGDTSTAHFGIRATGGGQHIISGCAFYPNADGGMMVQCIFFSGVNDCVITGNTAKNPYEKFAYIFGDRHIVSKNSIQGNAGFMPGTRIQGTITLVIRTHGNDNTIEGNTTEFCAGGAQVMGRGVADTGRGNSVLNNKFLHCGQGAISVYQGVLTGTKVRGNTCTSGNLAGFVAGDGIRLAANAGSRRVDVSANDVSGFSVADPLVNIEPWTAGMVYPKVALVRPAIGNSRFYVQAGAGGPSGTVEPLWPSTPGASVADGANVWVAVPFEGGQADIKVIGGGAGPDALIESSISDNTTSNGRLGIVLSYVAYTTIARNRLSSSVAGMSESDTSFNRWENNVCFSGATTVQGRSSTTVFITDPLMGSAPFDPPSVGAGQTTVTTVSVPGADVGDHATAIWPGALEVVSCRVTAANVATVRLQNFSGAANDDAPSTLHVRVTKV
nr:right-handed parallel beta-helix repeat-containing protein [Sphingomonas hankookensis]